MLLKPTGAVPHVGGQVMQPGEPYYEILRAWIADGAKLEPDTPKVAKIEVSPINPVVQQIGARAADPRAGDLRRRRGPRRDPRGVPRERQHRGRHGQPSRA